MKVPYVASISNPMYCLLNKNSLHDAKSETITVVAIAK